MRAWRTDMRKREFDVSEVRKGLPGTVRYHKIWKPRETKDTRLNSITNRRGNVFLSQQHSVRPYCLGTLELGTED